MFADIKRYINDLLFKIKRKGFSKKLPFIAVLCLVAILIPSMVAIWNVYLKKDAGFVASSNITVSFWDAVDDKELARDTVNEENISDSPVVSLFYGINSGKKLSASPQNAPDSPNFKLVITHGANSYQYECYFSQYSDSSYFISESKDMYAVNDDQYEKFLLSDYSNRVYSSAIPPSLTTENGATILPTDVNWYFKKAGGAFIKSDSYATTSEQESYQMSGTVALNFSVIPDTCDIAVFELSDDDLTKTEIYRGDLSRLAYVTAQSGQRLLFDVNAAWNESEKTDFYGELSYTFFIDCKDYATFEISSHTAIPGQFISIILHDVSNSESVVYSVDTGNADKNNILNKAATSDANTFSTNDAVSFLKNFTPQFIDDGDVVVAMLPIPYGTPSGSFSFTIASGVTKKSFSVEIGEPLSTDTVILDKSPSALSNIISDTALKEVSALLESISSQCRQSIMYNGSFQTPRSDKYSLLYSYADSFVINGLKQENLLALGNFYKAAEASDESVLAANSGIVAYTGYTPHLGNVAVVDHGAGICTWYCNLSSIDVAIGDVVAKDELVGKSGEATLMSSAGVLILCSVYDAFIDPAFILGK